jgi:PAS domain S-box-containing protein
MFLVGVKLKNKDKFKDIFDYSPIGLIFHDKNGNLTGINQSALDITGISDEQAKKVNLFDNPEISLRKAELINNKLIKFQAPLDFNNLKKSGLYDTNKTGIIFIDYIVSVTDSGFLVQIQDITKRKKAESKLKKGEKKYKTLFNTMLQGVVYQDANGHIISINPAAENIMGYNFEQIRNRTSDDPIWEAIHEDGTDFLGHEHPSMVALKTGKEVRNVVMGVRYPTREGYTWLNIHAIPEFKPGEKKPYQVYTTFEDITQRKKAEENLKMQAALLDVSYEAIFSWAYDDGIISWNQGAERLYGYSNQEVVGFISHELFKTEFPMEFNEFMEKLSDDKMWTGELTHTTKNGQRIIVESHMQLIQDNIGRNVVIETNRDITQRKLAEENKQKMLDKEIRLIQKLRSSNQELINITEELKISNEELRQTQDELTDTINKLATSNEDLEQFAYVASHDLQEPLRMIGSFTQLLERRYKGQLDSDADDYIGFIVDGASRMKDLIDDLLAFSRLNTEAREFELTDLENVFDDVLFNLEIVIEKNNAQITHESLPIVRCDSSQIMQLFQNLISNAIKFQSNKRPNIHIFVQESAEEWLFGVNDNGIGIESEHQKKIFDVFRRLNTRDEFEGTGIGLAICKRILERHDGRIWVDSEPGKGSTFYFTIPKPEIDKHSDTGKYLRNKNEIT